MEYKRQQSIYAQRNSLHSDDRQKIELFISCRNLKDMDYMSKSDPQVNFYQKTSKGTWILIGKTEMIKDNLNPNFAKSFIIDYVFEIRQDLKFEVIDIDGPGKNQFDYIGHCYTDVGSIVGARNQTVILDLKDKKNKNSGKIIIRCETVSVCRELLTMNWGCVDLQNVNGWFGTSSPFLRFFRSREDGNWIKVHETPVKNKELNPNWRPFTIKMQKLCNGDEFRPIKVECWSFFKNSEHKSMGEATFCINDLNNKKRQFHLIKTKQSGKKKDKGLLVLQSLKTETKYEFLDYIRGGVELALITAIDFTGSNGIPSYPDSLHAIKYGAYNQYQQAMMAVGSILLNYDDDRLVPMYGFGAKPKFPNLFSKQTQHCFSLTGNPNDANAHDMEGMMSVYSNALKQVELAGPTLFNPLISDACKIAQDYKASGSDTYIILLILTDGEIHDMNNTINSIIGAAHLPISIIIIGIGNADFGKMVTLDGDDGLWNHQGVKAQRDLVQFVPFNKFKHDPTELSKQVLYELPRQLVEYMSHIKKVPKSLEQMNISEVGMQKHVLSEQAMKVGVRGFSNMLSKQMKKMELQPSPIEKQQYFNNQEIGNQPQVQPQINPFMPQPISSLKFISPQQPQQPYQQPGQYSHNALQYGHNILQEVLKDHSQKQLK